MYIYIYTYIYIYIYSYTYIHVDQLMSLYEKTLQKTIYPENRYIYVYLCLIYISHAADEEESIYRCVRLIINKNKT